MRMKLGQQHWQQLDEKWYAVVAVPEVVAVDAAGADVAAVVAGVDVADADSSQDWARALMDRHGRFETRRS